MAQNLALGLHNTAAVPAAVGVAIPATAAGTAVVAAVVGVALNFFGVKNVPIDVSAHALYM